MSAIMSLVGQYLSEIALAEIIFQMKWKCMSMYFVCPWNVDSFERQMVPWLLQ